MTRNMSATSAEDISPGEDIVVIDAVGGSLKVARANTTSSSEQGQGS
jgi:membrane-bound ClpP family serine protease